MSVAEFFEDLTEGNFSHAFERLKDWWSGMPEWLQSAFTLLGKAAGDMLSSAAVAGYEAAEASDKTGLDKLAYAAEAAKEHLGDNYKTEMYGTLVSLIQMVWQSKQK